MKQIFTCCFLLLSLFSFTQEAPANKPDLLKELKEKVPQVVIVPAKGISKDEPVSKSSARITLRCGSTCGLETQPLIIVDGIPYNYPLTGSRNSKYGSGLANLNPNDIESFNILKGPVATALYCSRAVSGVIIITTKISKVRKFIIRDFLNGSRVAGATVSFVSEARKETLVFEANDSGVVMAEIPRNQSGYQITANAPGYQSASQYFDRGSADAAQDILLTRNTNSRNKLVLITSYCLRKLPCGNFYARTDSWIDTSMKQIHPESITLKAYPNPAQKGAVLHFQFNNDDGKNKTARIVNLDGKTMLQETFISINGKNDFQLQADPRWPAGAYFLQLFYENGKILASDKVVIQ